MRNNKAKQKANKLLENALSDLKATQTQLIQSEKLASLGELTAGIAHEIQNPLNFVNNFSDINRELLLELKEEMDNGHINEANDIVDDVIENEKKIIYHGKRADSIVRGMLRHSQSGTGKKELTDINALADEYLRLAYHGFRATDNSFNVLLKTNFVESIEKININPQDIGRVLLNLYNNAFYAVNEKNKERIPGYEPTVSIMTRKNERKIEIRVIDNGKGIAKKLLDKVFQPFFTTKPTGQGTGLGLSLSYDIVKAHGGELTVETNEENRTEFMIRIPVN
jgi:two-component system NtrC family sensor kinase